MVQHRLLDVAVEEFGQNGLEGASTRAIAAKAGTAMSSITYHYGGKQGLYLAAADHIVAEMTHTLAPALDLDRPVAEDDAVGARAVIHDIMATMFDYMLAEKRASWSLFIAREQAHPTEAFHRIYDGMMSRLLERMVALICVATGHRDRVASRIVTLTVLGQVFFARSSQAACLKLLERSCFDPATATAIKERIRANTDAILDRLIAEQQEPQ